MKFTPTTTLLALVIAIGTAFVFWPHSTNDLAAQKSESETSSTEPIKLTGVSQFGEDHSYTKTVRKFEELVHKYYTDRPVEFKIYLNSELGLEKDFFAYMSLGIAIDFSIMSPSHMATFAKKAPLMDMPFLFRDRDHWEKVLASDVFDPVEAAIYEKSDNLLIGYAGGGVRNLIVNKPVTTMEELKGLSIRVMGAPIQSRIFQAIGAAPTVIAYNEVYNAIQTHVIDAAENEAAGIDQMKFYEVGPEISLTQHSITLRPLMFSGKKFRSLPVKLQEAIRRAGREAGEHGRQIESANDAGILAKLEEDGKLRTHTFTERDELLRLANPVKEAYAKQIGSAEVLDRINAVQ